MYYPDHYAFCTNRDTGVALHVAIEAGDVEETRALLAAGASPVTLDEKRWTPLMRAARDGCAQACSRKMVGVRGSSVGCLRHWEMGWVRMCSLAPVRSVAMHRRVAGAQVVSRVASRALLR